MYYSVFAETFTWAAAIALVVASVFVAWRLWSLGEFLLLWGCESFVAWYGDRRHERYTNEQAELWKDGYCRALLDIDEQLRDVAWLDDAPFIRKAISDLTSTLARAQ